MVIIILIAMVQLATCVPQDCYTTAACSVEIADQLMISCVVYEAENIRLASMQVTDRWWPGPFIHDPLNVYQEWSNNNVQKKQLSFPYQLF